MVEISQFMVDKANEEFAELRVVISALESDNASLRRQLEQLKRGGGDAATEFMRQLERESAALRAALVASNNVIAVYTARGEDANE